MMVHITYCCHQCGNTCVMHESDETISEFSCEHCGEQLKLPADGFANGQLQRCLVCPCRELFFRKDFSQRIGIAIIVIGFLLSTVAWGFRRPILTFGILFATAAIDMVLYFTVTNLVQCYRCLAEYRGLNQIEEYGTFNLETHERFRQESARLAMAKTHLQSAQDASDHDPIN